jgi:YHS domain-containing protein
MTFHEVFESLYLDSCISGDGSVSRLCCSHGGSFRENCRAARERCRRNGVKGYDPVAYFTAGRPTPGLKQYAYRLKGVTYRFASAEDREEFEAAPEKYLPRYGGYCAYAMSLDRIADIDPSRWAIVNHKLYLNNNYLSFHLWSLDKDRNIASADRN